MKNKFFLFIAGLIVVGGMFTAYQFIADRFFPYRNIKTELRVAKSEPVLHYYQPPSSIPFPNAHSLEHITLTLNGNDQWEIDDWTIIKDKDPEAPILLTIELWDRGVLHKMESGIYNEKLKGLFSTHLTGFENLYLRWNPEMEVPDGGFPWANRGSQYAEAFKKFSILCRSTLPAAKIVWGPAGYSGLMENYPGGEFLDLASITINSDAEKNLKHDPGHLEEQLKRKLHRMRFVQVPILILGSKNTDVPKFREEWVDVASKEIQREKKETNFKNIFSSELQDHKVENNKLMVGVFDPNELLVNEREISVEHIFISFKSIKKGSYLKELKEILHRNHDAIITVEPGFSTGKPDERMILQKILEGQYDDIINKFYSSLPKTNQIIYLRFAHEMEIPIKRYPWQSQDPVLYIKAYRYFMNFPEQEFHNIKKVWGPAGDRGLLEWWPGEDVVDVISIAIYGLPDKNIIDPEKQESFAKIYRRKKQRINILNKPLFITEFGVKGDEEYQVNWLIEAAKIIKSEPDIIGVSYFNRRDVPKAWGDIEPPQWQISKKTYKKFVNELGVNSL